MIVAPLSRQHRRHSPSTSSGETDGSTQWSRARSVAFGGGVVGLGLRCFSMAPGSIPLIKETVCSFGLDEARDLATQALAGGVDVVQREADHEARVGAVAGDAVADARAQVQRGLVLNLGRDPHLPDARRVIGRDPGLGLEDAGAVDHHIDPLQRQVLDPRRPDERQPCAVDRDTALIMPEIGIPATMHRIEFQKMRVHFGIPHRIVDPGDLRATFEKRFQGELANAAEAIHCVNGHESASVDSRPISSTAFCREMRSSEEIGSAENALIRL